MSDKERKESDGAALSEARALLHAKQCGMDISDLLYISPEAQTELDLQCVQYPSEAYIIRNALQFRERVQYFMDKLSAGEVLGNGEDEEVEEAEVAPCAPAETADYPIYGLEEPAVT